MLALLPPARAPRGFLTTLQGAERRAGNPGAPVRERCGGLDVAMAAAWGLPTANQFSDRLMFLVPGAGGWRWHLELDRHAPRAERRRNRRVAILFFLNVYV